MIAQLYSARYHAPKPAHSTQQKVRSTRISHTVAAQPLYKRSVFARSKPDGSKQGPQQNLGDDYPSSSTDEAPMFDVVWSNMLKIGKRGVKQKVDPPPPLSRSPLKKMSTIKFKEDWKPLPLPSLSFNSLDDDEGSSKSMSRWGWTNNISGRLQYKYYNWRQDSINDLLILVMFNLLFIFIFGALRRVLVDGEDVANTGSQVEVEGANGMMSWVLELWNDMYNVMVLQFGQEFPEDPTTMHQVFSVVVVLLGLITFALVLALFEQIVLELLENNVNQGSVVYENNHTLICLWGVSKIDIELLTKVMSQLCHAHRSRGGTVIVVLSTQSKLELEKIFKQSIPINQRYGSTFVFRRGNPLQTNDLQTVSALTAKATILISDHSRSACEADAQSLRACVLLDEMYSKFDNQKNNQQSNRTQIRSKRSPISLSVTDCVDDRVSTSNTNCTQYNSGHIVVQTRSSNIMKLINLACSSRIIAIPTSNMNARRLARMVRQPAVAATSQQVWSYETHSSVHIYTPPRTSQVVGNTWQYAQLVLNDSTLFGIIDVGSGSIRMNPPIDHMINDGDQIVMLRNNALHEEEWVPLEQPVLTVTDSCVAPSLIKLQQLQRRQQQSATMLGSTDQTPRTTGTTSANQGAYSAELDASVVYDSIDEVDVNDEWGDGPDDVQLSNIHRLSGIERVTRRSDSNGLKERLKWLEGGGITTSWDEFVETEVQYVVVCGWADLDFMLHMVRELDHGMVALPKGSTLSFVNTHSKEDTIDLITSNMNVYNLTLLHTKAEPLNRRQLRTAVDIKSCWSVIILADVQWCDQDMDISNGNDINDQADLLRIDSLLMTVQLNIRQLMEEKNVRDINIIQEKVAFQGQTRFEDRYRLPLGQCVNMSSYGAKMLAHIAVDPRILLAIAAFGDVVDMSIRDAAYLVDPDEKVSWWELMCRAQSLDQTLIGYYYVPNDKQQPIKLNVNPLGTENRLAKIKWARDGQVTRLLLLTTRKGQGKVVSELMSSNDDEPKEHEEDAEVYIGKQAGVMTCQEDGVCMLVDRGGRWQVD